MNRTLKGKVAIVTGGGTGIGEAICRKFAREGARIVVNGLPGDPIEGPVGLMAGPLAATPPPSHLNLRHTQDGTRGKEIVKIP